MKIPTKTRPTAWPGSMFYGKPRRSSASFLRGRRSRSARNHSMSLEGLAPDSGNTYQTAPPKCWPTNDPKPPLPKCPADVDVLNALLALAFKNGPTHWSWRARPPPAASRQT